MPRKKRRNLTKALEERYGPDSAELIAQLEKIAFGRSFERPGALPGTVVDVHPTISEMQEAIMSLLAYQHGRPRQSLDVEVIDDRPKWNPDRLSVIELEQLERLATKGQLPGATIVEGQFTETNETKEKPE